MLIYEVKLELTDKTIYSSFLFWLKEHISEMLKFQGFEKADLIDEFLQKDILTVKYYVLSEEDLNSYIDNYSKQMRDKGIKLFKNSFKASRKVYPLAS